jgi:hypothetical protein
MQMASHCCAQRMVMMASAPLMIDSRRERRVPGDLAAHILYLHGRKLPTGPAPAALRPGPQEGRRRPALADVLARTGRG